MQPSEQAILADTFPPAKRGMAFAVYGIAVVMAPAIGPTLGGWITDNYSWRWIFFVNIPVGILSLRLTSRLIQDPPYLRRRKLSETKIDFVGLGLCRQLLHSRRDNSRYGAFRVLDEEDKIQR